jgi:hypothetical protein
MNHIEVTPVKSGRMCLNPFFIRSTFQTARLEKPFRVNRLQGGLPIFSASEKLALHALLSHKGTTKKA